MPIYYIYKHEYKYQPVSRNVKISFSIVWAFPEYLLSKGNDIMKKKQVPVSVAVPKDVYARMKTHVDKLGMKIKVWVARTIDKAVEEQKH